MGDEERQATVWFWRALDHCMQRSNFSGWGGKEALAAAAGISSGMVNEVLSHKKGRRSGTQEKIARAFGYDLVDFLALGRSLIQQETSGADEGAPLGPYSGPTRKVVVFSANCGHGITWTDGGTPVGDSLDTIELPLEWLNANSFCIRVHNNSMEPSLREGDLVLVDPLAKVTTNDIVFVSLSDDGDKLIKRYRPAGESIVLESDNRAYDPIILNQNNGREVRVYKVVRLVDRRL